MSAHTVQLLTECLERYEAQLADVQQRLHTEQQSGQPSKKRLARFERSIQFHERQIAETRAAIAREMTPEAG